jgi:Skp family chaperone for outer membrane proteins
MSEIICSMPGCQTAAGCQCNKSESARLRTIIAEYEAQIKAMDAKIASLRKELDDAKATARKEALDEIATWIEPQRSDVPAHGWEFAAAIRRLAGEERK